MPDRLRRCFPLFPPGFSQGPDSDFNLFGAGLHLVTDSFRRFVRDISALQKEIPAPYYGHPGPALNYRKYIDALAVCRINGEVSTICPLSIWSGSTLRSSPRLSLGILA
jgi:hypothetical protein